MAQPGNIPVKPKVGETASTKSTGIDDDSIGNAPLITKLHTFLSQYKPADEVQCDMLDDRYSIDLHKPMPDFDTPNSKAYAATDSSEPSKLLFAHVCKHGSIQRHRTLNLLKTADCRYIVQHVAAGVVTLSSTKEERFTIFYEQPLGIRLSDLMKKKRIPVNQAFIIEHILTPLAHGIQKLAELDTSHGLINPDNVFISDIAMLGPCVADPCGYSQNFCYESVERLQALPAAKGEGSVAHDYYALAVLLMYILYGPEHFEKFTRDDLVRSLIKQGPYNVLMQDKEAPEVFYDFFRGTLTLGVEERWSSKQITPWLGGKRYNVLPPPAPSESVRPYEFGEVMVNTRRELAHLFASDWEHMVVCLGNNQLTHWITVSLRNKELSETIGRLAKTAVDLSTKNEVQTSETLMNIILLLDPTGPIRIKHLAMNIDGLDTICVELYHQKAAQDLQIIARFIEANMVNFWLENQQKVHKLEYKIPTTINSLNIKLDRLRGFIRNSGMGFGIERALYELNPDMACISPLFDNAHVTTLGDLLYQLDKQAPKFSNDDDPIDRHIAAFLACKLNIVHEIRLTELSGAPALATNRSVFALYMLALAQERVNHIRLPGLSHLIIMRILPLLSNIHSRTMRQKIKTILMSYAPLGYLPKISDLVIAASHVADDADGFERAKAQFHQNALNMARYQKLENIEYESMKMGYNIARMVAYLCMVGSFLFVVRMN